MDKLSLLNLVNKYIDDERKRMNNTLSKSARNSWIEGDVKDELTALNDEFKAILNKGDKNERKNFTDSINAQFKTDYFINFLLNTSKHTEDYYKKLLKKCIIHKETIEDFLNPENNSTPNPKTVDFFTAFCKNQEREYGEETASGSITRSQRKQPLTYVTEKFSIAGATIIDEGFFEDIKVQEFSMAEFYTSMYDNDCQWFGVTQGWDVERKNFKEIKDKIRRVFEFRRTFKISLVVHGNGGVGKTCFLRRLAKELHKEQSFTILWLNSKTDNFLDQGLKIIEEKQDTNFLIFIEDWDKIFGNKDATVVKKFLEETNDLRNIRIIIGDRNIDKDYLNFLNNDIEPLLLATDENRYIIEKIVEKHTKWREVSQKLFENPENYNTSLFLLLFIIAHINKKEHHGDSYDLSEVQTIFRNIIESDINFIAEQEKGRYKGLAKALYYWAFIYAEHKIFISYETFLKLADHFDDKDDNSISSFFNRWNADDEILDRLKVYINKNKNGLIQFNHDILVDLGLSKIRFDKWKRFGTKIKLELLDVITDKGDDYSASIFLNCMFYDKQNIFQTVDEKLHYIKRLVIRQCKYQYHLNELKKLKPEDNKLVEMALFLWEHKVYYPPFWKKYFSEIANEKIVNSCINEILDIELQKNYHPEFVCEVMNFTKDREVVKAFSERVMRIENLSLVDNKIRKCCITYVTDQTKKKFYNNLFSNVNLTKENKLIMGSNIFYADLNIQKDFANNFLQSENYDFDDFGEITPICLELSDSSIRKKFVNNTLLSGKVYKTKRIIKKCLQFADKKIAKQFAENSLKNKQREFFDDILLTTCLELASDEVKQNFCRERIMQEVENAIDTDFTELYFMFASENTIKEFYDKYLTNDDWGKIDNCYVELCLRYSTKEMKTEFVDKLLIREDWKEFFLICMILFDYATEELAQNFADKILMSKRIDEIWMDINSDNIKNDSYKILELYCKRWLDDENYWVMAGNVVAESMNNTIIRIKSELNSGYLSTEYWDTIIKVIISKCFIKSTNEIRNEICTNVLLGNEWLYCDAFSIKFCLDNVSEEVVNSFLNKSNNEDKTSYYGVFFELCKLRISQFRKID